ncbi:MerR family transcriptional regulator [Nocardia sp. NPDC049149]|uniref:MerR family transcriptional regulator n=1 Tax=Nocardia sp. NPDC049149 TaxID=3364315 RepID=UPI00371305AD
MSELVGISEAARRCGVAVSTLRYWEERGLIQATARRAGVRQFDADQMLRIGLIQLWQEFALLSLDEIAIMLADEAVLADDAAPSRVVMRERIRAIEEQQRRLAEGKAHLEHSLKCTSPHPAGRCDFMREVVRQRMSGNRVDPSDLDYPA